MAIEIVNMDILQWAREYNGPKFHALFCDPPYHHYTIQKRFGDEYSAKAQYGRDGAFQRASRGFMGKEWDGGDIAYRPSTWRALGRHMHPGAFGMAFASARGYHRMVTAIEREEEYCDVGRQRVAFWAGYGDVSKPQTQQGQSVQSSIFDLGEAA